MEYMDFLNAVCDHINESSNDVRVSIHSAIKNNGVKLSGLSFHMEGYNASPTIYMNSYYEDYLNGCDISDIAQRLLSTYHDNDLSVSIDMSFFDRFESVKDRLFIKLINRSKNTEFLTGVPYEEFLDLAVIAYVRMNDKKIGDGVIIVRNEHLEHWNVDKATVLDAARKNTHDRDGFTLQHIMDVLGNLSKIIPAEDDGTRNDLPMYVATNSRMINGAVVLTMKDKLREYASVIGGDYYIIPSSVHELILLGRSGSGDRDFINEMICEVNRTQLGPDDVLADHVYVYSKNDDVLIF